MKYILCALLFHMGLSLTSQEPNSFTKEVKDIVHRNDSLWNSTKETIVFTGSSSIRFWKDLQERFPEKQILNAGFGGSQASDLLVHLDDLVIRYEPKKVFIYEGDNDIFAKKRPKKIVITTQTIINKLEKIYPAIEVVLISAKPSISRWNLRGKYKRLNKKLAKYASNKSKVTFVDVWKPMLNERKLKEDLFVEDGLHMNKKGYDIWYKTLKNYVY